MLEVIRRQIVCTSNHQDSIVVTDAEVKGDGRPIELW
jgi:hypothetical protein